MKLTEAAENLTFKIKLADEKKRADSKGKGCVHHLKTVTADGSLDNVYLQLPRALTFGVRPNMNNSGPVPKYQLTLKFNFDQKGAVVDPLRDVHELIKAAIVDSFHTILPKTTSIMLKKMRKKNNKIPEDLFQQDHEAPEFVKVKESFVEAAREKIDEICIFGGSEEDFDMHRGKAKMVSFAPAKTGKDGKSYDKAWTVNVACPIKMKRGGGVEFCSLEDGEIDTHRPLFNFTACESPENNLKKTTTIPSENILDKLAPVDGTPFSRDGIAVVCLPYIHVRDDESSVSVNISLEHFHALLREQASVLGKRSFAVIQDDDTPQQRDDEEEEEASYGARAEEDDEVAEEEEYD